jgi:hypothetical protein
MTKSKQAVEKKGEESILETRVKALTAVSNKIDAINQTLKEQNAQYEILERELLEAMQQQGLMQVATAKATASLTKRTFVNLIAEEYDQFMAYVFKHKAVDLLQRRVNQRAYLDRVENGEKVPGVKTTEVPTISLRRK